MTVWKAIFLLAVMLISGLVYYKLAVSKDRVLSRIAIFLKVALLVLSFIMTFTKQDYIQIGSLALGGNTSVLYLIIIQIADIFIDRKKEK